jgi:hypothetical protein
MRHRNDGRRKGETKIDFIIQRKLHLSSRRSGQKTKTSIVSIGGIERMPGGHDACYFKVPLHSRKRKKIYGEDPMQALLLCLRHVRELIQTEMEHRNVDIWWVKKGDGGGFELLSNTRDEPQD